MAPVQILIVGTGAVGAFYGSRLAQAPQTQVSVTCRSNYQAVKENGLQMQTHSFGDYHFSPHAVYPSVEAAAESGIPWDYIVVTTKALPDLTDDSQTIAPLLKGSADTSVVLIQNGVGVEEPHRNRFPNNPILSAVTVVSAAQIEPGVIRQNRWTRISIGPFIYGVNPQSPSTNASNSAELEERSTIENHRLIELLQKGGIKDAEEYDEKGLQLVRWHKLAINASMNPSSVLSGGIGNARMSTDPELRLHLAGCMNEIFATAPRVLGRPWPAKLSSVTSDKILKSSERNSGDGAVPSMLLDWESGRPMELEVILGNPIRLARSRGIEMPRLQSLYALLKMAQTRRGEKERNVNQDEEKGKAKL